MGKISLLDCTLRDGGYVNDWEFGHNNIQSIFERLTDSGVDVIEIGFLDERRPYDRNRSIMPDTESAGKLFDSISVKPSMVVGMIDYGTCGISRLQPCKESFLDGIRVIFKKHVMHEAMAFCAECKALGYKVFSQLVSVTSYSDEDLKELIELVNEVEPYAVSMVDTYGLLHPQDLLHYYEQLDKQVKPGICIGFHPHNNFQLAYANSIAFLERKTERNILVDGTLFGMGKSAGNAPLELLAMYMNQNRRTDYRIQPMLEAIEESIQDFYRKSPWGYKMFFYLSAKNRCHPSYVQQFQQKENLSESALDELLIQIEPEEKKLLYDKELGEQLYEEYQSSHFNDKELFLKLGKAFQDRKILIIGPGKNIQLQNEKVQEYLQKEKPVCVSINYIPGSIDVDYVFLTNKKRYLNLADSLCEVKNRNVKLIATSNLTCRKGEFDYQFSRAPLLERNERITDNSFLMLLKILQQSGVTAVTCAGLDGYSDKEDNYFNSKMEYRFVKEEAKYLNQHVRKVMLERYKSMQIEFLTYSHYMDVEDSQDAAF